MVDGGLSRGVGDEFGPLPQIGRGEETKNRGAYRFDGGAVQRWESGLWLAAFVCRLGIPSAARATVSEGAQRASSPLDPDRGPDRVDSPKDPA